MNSTTNRKMIQWLLILVALFGLYLIFSFIVYNAVRGDEFLSFLHSSPQWDSLRTVIRNIHAGADNSYTHAAVLYVAFSLFGHTIVVQRLVSFVFWMAGLFVLKYMIGKGSHNSLWVMFAVFVIAFSNFGIYLATDGRFYSILFFFAACQLLIYTCREGIHPALYFMLLLLTQLAGLLTSSNFIVLQCVFLPSLLITKYVFKHNDEQKTLITSTAATAVSSFIYFAFLKIPSFHHFFLQNLFTEKPFNGAFLMEFISNPFRWIMIPHLPFLSDQLDVAAFCGFICVLFVIRRKELKTMFQDLSDEYPLMDIMASVLFAMMFLQLLAMTTIGFPLWMTRYYTPVFFTVTIVIAYLLFHLINLRILTIVIVALCFRLIAGEYPKVETRKAELAKATAEQQLLIGQHKPVVFVETETDYSTFSQLGNMYVRNPQLQEQLMLKYNSRDLERRNYFLRLKQLNYPLLFVTEIDSIKQTVVVPSP